MTDPNHDKHADGIVEDREKAPPVYFTLLFYGLIAWGVVFIAYFLFSGWSSHGEFEEKMAAHTGQPVAMQTETAASAEAGTPAATPSIDAGQLYAAKCAGCHGAKGEGAFGPDLTADSYKYGRDIDVVRSSIADGRPKSMPGFAGSLSAAEIDALSAFVLEL